MIYEKVGEKIVLKKLKNGLDIIVMPKKGVNKKYAVFSTNYGSIDGKFIVPGEEQVTIVPDGIAHFLEHKLFEQEDGVNALDKLAKIGASANAYTSFNHTAYLFECTDHFEEAFSILLHFVQNPYLTKENVEKEKGIIGQEIRMYEDDPNWQLFFNFLNCLYKNHMVRKDIAGTIESISHIDENILLKCYHTFYRPSNMVLFVVGDVEPEVIFNIVEEKVRTEDNQEEIIRIHEEEPDSLNQKRIEKKMDVSIPMFMMGFKDNYNKVVIRHGYEEDNTRFVKRHVAIEIILEILVGKSSSLYEELYNEGLVTTELGTEYDFEANYGFSAVSGEAKEPQKVIDRIVQRLEELKKDGLNREEIERVKKTLYGNYVRGFNHISKIATMFISDYFKGINSFTYLDVYQNIKLEEIEEVLKEHFKSEQMAISIINS